MRSPARAFCWFLTVALLLQGMSTLAARLIPAIDRAFPALLVHTQMQPTHSLLHIVTGLIGLAVLVAAGARGAFHFALWFSLFYTALAAVGMATGASLGLGLQTFDHPFHFFIGGLGLIATGMQFMRDRPGGGRAK